jgi:predicted DNA-binding transcriptional regulator AlpA
MQEQDDFVGSARLCSLLNRSTQTIYRWCKNPELGFPQPIRINNHRYWRRQEILEFMMSKRKTA